MLKIDDLGLSHTYSENDRAEPGMLTVHEAGELIRRAGLELGLIPKPEHQVPSDITKTGKRLIDWVWFDQKSSKAVAAFEIEGANCRQEPVDKDLDSLGNIECPFKIVFLYQARRDSTLPRSGFMEKNIDRLNRDNIRIKYDVDMMNGEMDDLILEVGKKLKITR